MRSFGLSFVVSIGLILAACGGQVTSSKPGGGGSGTPADGGSGGGQGTGVGVAADSGIEGRDASMLADSAVPHADATACVDVDPASYGTACKQASDCALIKTGEVCSGTCGCGGDTAVSSSEVAKYESAISGISFEACPCVAPFLPACVQGVCTPCGKGLADPPECSDSAQDAGAPPPADAGQCVFVDPSKVSLTCKQNSDCTLVSTGMVCSGQCDCGGSPANTQSATAINQTLTGITFEACPCLESGMPGCIQGQCAVCGSPSQPPCPLQ